MKILKAVINFIKKYWMIILLLAAVYFAPAISAWLSSAGAPSFLVQGFSWIGTTLTPGLTSVVGWLTSGAGALWTKATAAWGSLSLGTQAAIALGAVAALAPEETADALTEIGEFVGETAGTIIGSVAGGLTSGGLGWIIGGVAAFFAIRFLLAKKDDKEEVAK